jgi:hypothetical protein
MQDKLLMWIFSIALKNVSTALASALSDALATLAEKAHSTPNPWDDVAVKILRDVLSSVSNRD